MQNQNIKTWLPLIVIISLLVAYSCSRKEDPVSPVKGIPVLTTSDVSAITETAAQCGGNVNSDGGATVTARGVCWSTNSPPTIADDTTSDSTGTGSFTSSLTGLASGTDYYVRAYATNSTGTGYGGAESFTTMTTWSTTFGGSAEDMGHSVAATSDGGYIVSGHTSSFGAGSSDVYMIKTDALGNETWSKTFGGSAEDKGHSVAATSDGGYIITGYTKSFGAGNSDVYLIKTDASGNETWSKTFGGSDHDYGQSVAATSDGGYIITGYTESFGAGNSDVYLIKTDASGNETWSKTFGGSDHDYGQSVAATSDGGYIITGYTESFGAGNSDVYLIKTDASGNETWSKTFGGSAEDKGHSVAATSDGGYIITGHSHSFGTGNSDVYLIKTNAFGNETWSIILGGTDSDIGLLVAPTSDGGYIITGHTHSFGAGNYDVYLIKTDASGNETWSKSFGGSDSDIGHSVLQTSDGGYIIAGLTTSFGAGSWDVYLIKTDALGNVSE